MVTRQPTIPAQRIYKALLQTKAAQSLRETTRYQPFRHSDESPAYWRKVLGPSGITLSHLKQVYMLTRKLLQHEVRVHPRRFSRADQEMLLIAALVHDFGEAILDEQSVGDIPAPLKGAEHDRREKKVFRQVLALLALKAPLKKKIWTSYLNACHNKKPHLHQFFHLIEHIDYLDTGIRVYENTKKRRLPIRRGAHLIGQILTFSIPLLVNYSKNLYPSTHAFLRKRQRTISSMFHETKSEYLRAEKKRIVISGFESAYEAWNVFTVVKR